MKSHFLLIDGFKEKYVYMVYTDNDLIELIRKIRTQKREADYWDVKQEWHEKTEDLIKDIICFANTVHDKDCFLIFGINDDLKVCGMEKERTKQCFILDTLSKLQFAGDVQPDIELKTATVQSDIEPDTMVEVDILIIYNTYLTPIYLKKMYGKMIQGCIYSRIGDKNTENNGNSDIRQIEMLWKKRFGLTKSPYEYIIDHLADKSEWHEYDNGWYNIYKPEYVLYEDFGEEKHGIEEEFYSYALTNESTSFHILNITANNTVLNAFQVAVLDSGRLSVPRPEWGYVHRHGNSYEPIGYKYYVEGSNRYRILQFLYDPCNHEEEYAMSDFMRVVLLFRSETEKEDFMSYIEGYLTELFERVEECKEFSYLPINSDRKKADYQMKLRLGIVLNEMLSEFRKIEY